MLRRGCPAALDAVRRPAVIGQGTRPRAARGLACQPIGIARLPTRLRAAGFHGQASQADAGRTRAYTLIEAMQRLARQRTSLARAYAGTLRLKLLEIGAVVLRNTGRARLLLSGHHPEQHLFALVVARLAPD